jgi:5'-nucleotidase
VLFSSRSRVSSRLLTAGVGIGLVATPLAFVTPAAQAADPVNVTILATNDFHGRLTANGAEAGAAVLAGAVKQLRSENPNTVFAAAGDLIGASTFDSFIQNDKPTIDALNEAGLDVSAVGNHEFDKGYDDLMNRVIAPESAANPDGGAKWKYIGANVEVKPTAPAGTPLLDPSWTKTFGTGDAAVTVGFVGAVTEDLPSLVSPAGISDITVSDIVDATNTEADALKAGGADLVVLLVHEGASGTNCATMDDSTTSPFGSIINGVNANVDAIVSGHTHLAYDCKFPVAAWAERAVKERPVVSAGQYGTNLNRLTFAVDPADGSVDGLQTAILPLVKTPAYPADPATKSIVDAAVEEAKVLGAVPLGEIAGPFYRAKLADGTTENRGAESTLGNLVAEVQQWATETPEAGASQIAFMNPGGLRDDLLGTVTGDDRVVSYRQAAAVQSFANTLVNMRLTGADIKEALEQQWQTNPGGTAPSRPFLKLGASKGFEYTYDPNAAQGSRITSMTLHGQPIDPATSYSVTVNAFLGAGGDNFRAFNNGTNKRDTGKVDLQAMVDYMAEFANSEEGDPPLPVDSTQRAVGVSFPAGAPATYQAGSDQAVAFDVSSWSFTGPQDVTDSEVLVSVGRKALGAFALDNSPQAALPGFDEAGKASVSVMLPATVRAGTRLLVLTGATTGTRITVPIVVTAADQVSPTVTIKAPDQVRQFKAAKVRVVVKAAGAPGTGNVRFSYGGQSVIRKLDNGVVTVKLGIFKKPGPVKVSVTYLGNVTTKSVTKTVTIRVIRR